MGVRREYAERQRFVVVGMVELPEMRAIQARACRQPTRLTSGNVTMRSIDTIRTVTRIEHAKVPLARLGKRPKFKKGDYVEVYAGRQEGHSFWISDIRYSYDRGEFEYYRNNVMFEMWHSEKNLTRFGR